MDECVISFKATVNGLILIMREEDDFEAIVREMEKKLDTSGKFFKGASISVKYRGKQLTSSQEEQIKTLMTVRTGAEIKSFGFDVDQPESQPNEKEADRGDAGRPQQNGRDPLEYERWRHSG
ncbi:MAG: hypothetical protein HGA22_01150 [Clostridiales bacterium]|nr:hypothetical protein [Clostridiales bacterium]